MANLLVTEIVTARAKAAIAAAASLQGVEHPFVKGRLRELVIEELLRPILPPTLGLGTGIVVDSKGGSSGEIDIVIFNREVLPPILFSARDGVFPVEACLYAFEVKSVLELRDIGETVGKFRKLQQLQRLRGANSFEPIGGLLAFRDKIAGAGDEILYHYDSIDADAPPLIRVGCVVGRGYWYFRQPSSSWGVFDADKDHRELVRFIGGLANTGRNNDWSQVQRGPFRLGNPPIQISFGEYIIPENVSRDVPRPATPVKHHDAREERTAVHRNPRRIRSVSK